MADSLETFAGLGTALGLGLLVGLQRESAKDELGGLRTFPLVTLLGAACGLLPEPFAPWALAAGLLSVAAAAAVGNLARIRGGDIDPGITTEVALLVMFVLGALAVSGPRVAAVALGGTVAVLLHFKAELHGIVERLAREDVRALMQFALIALVILPVLPDVDVGPYAVFNPREIWLMVVLVAGLSLAGYLASRFLSRHAGALTAGLLGGVISSTATTVSWARRTRAEPEAARLAVLVILIASTVVYGRVLAEIAAVARPLLEVAAPPVLCLMAGMALSCVLVWRSARKEEAAMPAGGPPTELKAALGFAALYAVVLLAVAFARDRLGDRGLLIVSLVSGLTDVDAITLSVSRLFARGSLAADEAWRLIAVAALSNLFFKGVLAATLGDVRLRRWVLLMFGAQLVVGALVLALWPS